MTDPASPPARKPRPPSMRAIGIKWTDAEIKELDAIAKRKGISRAAAVRLCLARGIADITGKSPTK